MNLHRQRRERRSIGNKNNAKHIRHDDAFNTMDISICRTQNNEKDTAGNCKTVSRICNIYMHISHGFRSSLPISRLSCSNKGIAASKSR